MKTLHDHTILYDGVCPMCNLYTRAFVKTGMLDKNGRLPYQDVSCEILSKIDQQRAVDEIALINKQTGEVQYGIDSLFTILGHSYPVFLPLFKFRPFYWCMKKVYKFISYNRRVIIPSAKENSTPLNEPAFNLPYRLFYLVFTWLLTASILYNYSFLLEEFIPGSNFFREFLICGGQILWQSAFIFYADKKTRWTYLGNMMTISFAGGLLLLIGLVCSSLFHFGAEIYVGYFLLVAFLMMLEHIRRTKLLSLGSYLTLTWILYRLILLIIITL